MELADRVGGRAVRLLDVPDALADADLLLTSTGASAALLQVDDLRDIVRGRAGRPLLIVDIAVPRDVDPAVGALEGVTLLDMDDLRRFAEAGTAARRGEVAGVQAILDEELERYLGSTSAREVAPMIVALRERAEEVRRAELERFRSRLGELDDEQLAAVEGLTRGILGKLLHEPSGHPEGRRRVAPRRSAGRRPARALRPRGRARRIVGRRVRHRRPGVKPVAGRRLRAATRGSPLARWQAAHIA